jgi:hypothetical protein
MRRLWRALPAVIVFVGLVLVDATTAGASGTASCGPAVDTSGQASGSVIIDCVALAPVTITLTSSGEDVEAYAIGGQGLSPGGVCAPDVQAASVAIGSGCDWGGYTGATITFGTGTHYEVANFGSWGPVTIPNCQGQGCNYIGDQSPFVAVADVSAIAQPAGTAPSSAGDPTGGSVEAVLASSGSWVANHGAPLVAGVVFVGAAFALLVKVVRRGAGAA